MRQEAVALFLSYLLLYACGGVEAGKRKQEERRSKDRGSGFWGALTYMAVGGGASGGRKAREGGAGPAAGVPSSPPLPAGLLAAGLPALGFLSTGIAANSVGASLMSLSAVANGGGVPAGGLVATLQSLGEWAAGPPGRAARAR
uniref:Interferon alpha inducible protein 6 n=1 Tax=Ursus americanus TaxID=9643 RepID=A0A452S2E0_URSAM